MTPWYRRPGFWNLPNVLTLMRMVLVPLMVVLLYQEPDRWMALVAFAIFIGAMLTDIVDGALARKWGLTSITGAFLDPLADKLMVVTTVVMLVWLRWLPPWIAAVLICREITVTALRAVAQANGLTLPADSLGKLKTALQSTALGFMLWHYETAVWLWPEVRVDAHSAGLVLMHVAVVVTVLSMGNYLLAFFRHAKQLTS